MTGKVSEIAVLAPIKRGRVPGERRTFEERLRSVIDNIQRRSDLGIPTLLNRIHTIHFGRLIIIRPENYLHYSNVPDVAYEDDPRIPPAQTGANAAKNNADAAGDPLQAAPETEDNLHGEAAPKSGHRDRRIAKKIDDYEHVDLSVGCDKEPGPNPPKYTKYDCGQDLPVFRSHLLTIVTFDGDLKRYFRDIADFLGNEFDRVFENCEDFDSTKNFEVFWSWIRRYQIPVDLFHPAYPDLTVVEIKRLQDFKRCFDEFVARVRKPRSSDNPDINELFDQFLRDNQQYAGDFPSSGGIYKNKG